MGENRLWGYAATDMLHRTVTQIHTHTHTQMHILIRRRNRCSSTVHAPAPMQYCARPSSLSLSLTPTHSIPQYPTPHQVGHARAKQVHQHQECECCGPLPTQSTPEKEQYKPQSLLLCLTNSMRHGKHPVCPLGGQCTACLTRLSKDRPCDCHHAATTHHSRGTSA